MAKKRVSKKETVTMPTRDPKMDLVILVAIIAIFALLIMFLNFPR